MLLDKTNRLHIPSYLNKSNVNEKIFSFTSKHTLKSIDEEQQ
jgi:hypothetical protein